MARLCIDLFLPAVRHNSIHDSYQRAATIHATNYYTVENNFAFNVFGHTIFVEDGVERHNIIRHNLVVLTKPCIMCIASDTKPSNFWMQSPTNNWINNSEQQTPPILVPCSIANHLLAPLCSGGRLNSLRLLV